MPTLTRIVANTKVVPTEQRRDLDALQAQLTQDTGVICEGVTLEPDYDPSGDPGNARLTLDFDSAPVDAVLDASIAAFPKLVAPIGPVEIVAANIAYPIYSQTVEIGHAVAFDVHTFLGFGTQADFDVTLIDNYTAAWRRTTGDVLVLVPQGSTPGKIPGMRIEVTSDASTVTVSVKLQRAGTLHVFGVDVETEFEGFVAP